MTRLTAGFPSHSTSQTVQLLLSSKPQENVTADDQYMPSKATPFKAWRRNEGTSSKPYLGQFLSSTMPPKKPGREESVRGVQDEKLTLE